MKTKDIITILTFSMSTAFFLNGCKSNQNKQNAELQDALETIDKNVGAYDPSVAIKEGSSHRALILQYAGGMYTLDSISEARKGRLPYKLQEKNSLPFRVTFYDAQNKPLGGYSIENPMMLRSCEPGAEDIRMTDSMQFEILIPDNRNISTVRIAEQQKELASFSLSPR